MWLFSQTVALRYYGMDRNFTPNGECLYSVSKIQKVPNTNLQARRLCYNRSQYICWAAVPANRSHDGKLKIKFLRTYDSERSSATPAIAWRSISPSIDGWITSHRIRLVRHVRRSLNRLPLDIACVPIDNTEGSLVLYPNLVFA